ncbi:hypothetical protein KZX32_05915 [Corynebacterium kefirresidentii]|uniref:hypothetical protein n=1 Tax=Corynebacterium kefirresidentii TaxID=1979527 RepID=UPI002002EAF7|nr:hypothetical protein [Corynebacterium kefirresidentii]MCK6083027.1 hypothetical protein [Corynebacterium kefirresidentii]
MSKQDQAAKVIKFGAARGYTPEQIATLLNELNLLAPDLPEPSRGMTPRGAVWYLNTPIGDIRRAGEDIVVFGHDYQHQTFRLVLNEAEAETIAHALLAAANHAEEA